MPALVASPVSIPALDNATLDANGSVCYYAPCSYDFELVCSNASTITWNGTDPTAIITTGKGATGYDVNMLDVPAGATCNATVVVTHVYTGTSATATAILQVGVSINAACAWLRNPDTCAHPSGKSLQLHANSSTFVKHM